MALYAGDGVGAVQAIEPAALVLAHVVAEADELLALSHRVRGSDHGPVCGGMPRRATTRS